MGTCFLVKQNDDKMKRGKREALQNLQNCNCFFLLRNTKGYFFAPSFGNLSPQLQPCLTGILQFNACTSH